MTDAAYCQILRTHARPLAPRPTGEEPMLRPLPGLRCVLFDIYGTLLISASGDIGTLRNASRGEAFTAALQAAGLDATLPGDEGVREFVAAIEASHAASRRSGIEHPEVDVVHIWPRVLRSLADRGAIPPGAADRVDLKRLAVEYEARTNPVWPMPGLLETLADLRAAGLALGALSNAQFFTPLLFPALVGRTLDELGFDPALVLLSYRVGEGKPGRALFRAAAAELERRGIAPDRVLYVGNDLLNDVLPARDTGFHTALFAGDARSLRRRQRDPRTAGLSPDLVLTDLSQCSHVIRL